jgi:hypothetical protein
MKFMRLTKKIGDIQNIHATIAFFFFVFAFSSPAGMIDIFRDAVSFSKHFCMISSDGLPSPGGESRHWDRCTFTSRTSKLKLIPPIIRALHARPSTPRDNRLPIA